MTVLGEGKTGWFEAVSGVGRGEERDKIPRVARGIDRRRNRRLGRSRGMERKGGRYDVGGWEVFRGMMVA